jgi:hypothetical protein
MLYSGQVLQSKIHPVRNIFELAVSSPRSDQGCHILSWLLTSTAKTHRQRWPWAMQTGSLTERTILHAQAVSSRQRQRKWTGGEQSFDQFFEEHVA